MGIVGWDVLVCASGVLVAFRTLVCMKLVVMILAAVSLWAQNDSDKDAIRGVVKQYADARNAEKPDAVEHLFMQDADQLVSTGVWRRGRDEVVKGTLASSRNNEGQRTLTVDTIRFVTTDVAIADCRYEIQGAQVRKMWSTFVFARTKQGWRIDAIRNMLPAK